LSVGSFPSILQSRLATPDSTLLPRFGVRLLASLFSFSSVVGGNDDLILQFTYFTTNKQTDTPVSYPL